MDAVKIEEFKDDFALLIEAGFIAVKQLDEMSAKRLFLAAQVLNPESTTPLMGIGYISLNKLEIKEATRIFENVTKLDPENYLAQTFLGMCFLLTKGKMKKGEEIIKAAMEKSEDETVKNLGQISLLWSAKDLANKMKAPFFAKQKEPEAEES